MRPEKIQYLLKCAGITQHQIAVELGVTDFHVHAVIYGRQSDRVQRAIAAKLDRNVIELFPGRYTDRRNTRKPSAYR